MIKPHIVMVLPFLFLYTVIAFFGLVMFFVFESVVLAVASLLLSLLAWGLAAYSLVTFLRVRKVWNEAEARMEAIVGPRRR